MQKPSHSQKSEQLQKKLQENINTQRKNLQKQYTQFYMVAKTQAQIDFLEREDQNVCMCSIDFNSWYHNTDVRRILWTLFQEVEEQTQKKFIEPYVFFDCIQPEIFSDLMTLAKNKLIESDKLYFPFIIKPETGNNHYMAGIIRKNNDLTQEISNNNPNVTLLLFNPLGYTKDRAKKRLHLENADEINGMTLLLSPSKVQSEIKDGDKLVSCGPLSIKFIQYAINNPEWIEKLDAKFELPEDLSRFACYNKFHYELEVQKTRRDHFYLLEKLPNNELKILELNAKNDEYFINSLENLRDSQFNDDKIISETENKSEKESEYEYDSAEDEYIYDSTEEETANDAVNDSLQVEETSVNSQHCNLIKNSLFNKPNNDQGNLDSKHYNQALR